MPSIAYHLPYYPSYTPLYLLNLPPPFSDIPSRNLPHPYPRPLISSKPKMNQYKTMRGKRALEPIQYTTYPPSSTHTYTFLYSISENRNSLQSGKLYVFQ